MKIIYLIFIFIFSIFLIYRHKKSIRAKTDNIDRELQKQEEKLTLLRERDNNLLQRNRQLERSLNEIVTIYEYVKKLGSTMDFNEAIESFNDALLALTHFKTAKLVLLNPRDISNVYKIYSTKEVYKVPETTQLLEYEKRVVSKMLNSQQVLLYEKGKLTPLGIFPQDVDTLISFPLSIEKQLVGVVLFENIPLVNTDKIYFLTLQFALEVKKTQLYEKVKELSIIDGLTGLYLRRHFSNLLANELDRGYRQGHCLSLLMMDVDTFKKYNDEYGHLAGDLILKKLAGIFKEKSREIDILCRYGGDEFILVLPRTSLLDAEIVAERLRRAVNECLFCVANEQFQVSISIGISTCSIKDMRLDGISETLIDSADKALYKAKTEGRNRVVLAE